MAAPRRAVTAGLLLAIQFPSLAQAPEEWSRHKFGERLVRNAETARAVDALLLPDETFFEWGHEAELYYYSGRRPPAGEFRSEYLVNGPRQPERTARLLADLARTEPQLLLISRVHPFPLDHPVPQWLLARYVDMDAAARSALSAQDYRVLVWRDGPLDARLRGPAGWTTAVR